MNTQTKKDRGYATLTCYVSNQSKIQLIKEAQKRRRSVSEFVDMLLEDWLKGTRQLTYEKEK